MEALEEEVEEGGETHRTKTPRRGRKRMKEEVLDEGEEEEETP